MNTLMKLTCKNLLEKKSHRSKKKTAKEKEDESIDKAIKKNQPNINRAIKFGLIM